MPRGQRRAHRKERSCNAAGWQTDLCGRQPSCRPWPWRQPSSQQRPVRTAAKEDEGGRFSRPETHAGDASLVQTTRTFLSSLKMLVILARKPSFLGD